MTDGPGDSLIRPGLIAGISAYLMWGLLTIYWHELQHFDAFELIGWRIILSAAVILVVLFATRRWRPVLHALQDRAMLARVCAAAVLLTVNWTAYVFAIVHGRVIETALGYFTAPVGTMLVGLLVLHERIHKAQWAAIGFAVAAIAVLTVSYGHVPYLALAIATSWTFYGLLKKQVKLPPVEGMAAETLVLLVPAIVVVIVTAGSATSIPSAASSSDLTLLAFSGIVTIIPLVMFAYAAHRVPLTILGPLQYSVPTINFLLGWLIYNETMPGSRVVGFAMVWVGLAILTVDSARRARAGRATPADRLTRELQQEEFTA